MISIFADLAAAWSHYPIIWSPHVSKNGDWLAWSWTGHSDTANVWMLRTDGTMLPQQLTTGTDHFNVNGIDADGGRLIVAQGRGGNEHDRLFLLSRDSAELQPLTPEQSDHYVFGGSFHDDGRSILYTANVDYETGQSTHGSRLYVQDLITGKRRVIAHAHSIVDRTPEISPDGRQVLYHRSDLHPAGTQIWLAAWDGSADRQIFSAGDRCRAYGYWIDDGRVLVQAETKSHTRIGELDLRSSEIRWIVDDPVRNIESVVIGADGRQAILIEFMMSRLKPSLLDMATGKETLLDQQNVSLLPLQQHPNGDWIVEAYRSDAPHAFQRINLAFGEIRQLAVSSSELHHFTPARDFQWTAHDGKQVQGWLYEAQGQSRGLIVWVHGGPTWHSEDWVNPVVQFLVSAGFTVLDPNYRGSTGFGIPFREAIKRGGWGGAEQDDIRSGIEALIASGKACAGKVGVAGLSYGGYSSWVAITRFADLVNAACAICGMYELDIDYHNTEMPHGRAYSEEMMGGPPEQFPERYFNASPRNFVDNIKGRLMIVHGLADSNVSPTNTDLAVKDLDERGIVYRLLTFPDEGHGIYKAGNRARWLSEMGDFFAEAFAS